MSEYIETCVHMFTLHLIIILVAILGAELGILVVSMYAMWAMLDCQREWSSYRHAFPFPGTTPHGTPDERILYNCDETEWDEDSASVSSVCSSGPTTPKFAD